MSIVYDFADISARMSRKAGTAVADFSALGAGSQRPLDEVLFVSPSGGVFAFKSEDLTTGQLPSHIHTQTFEQIPSHSRTMTCAEANDLASQYMALAESS